uniref:Uncharacterized protein n=1 Tax=Rhizophora mucronata TaxID=61149 RepID=A0A2P2PVK6_RHIMU
MQRLTPHLSGIPRHQDHGWFVSHRLMLY